MAKTRRDDRGRVLKKGEVQRASDKRYTFVVVYITVKTVENLIALIVSKRYVLERDTGLSVFLCALTLDLNTVLSSFLYFGGGGLLIYYMNYSVECYLGASLLERYIKPRCNIA